MNNKDFLNVLSDTPNFLPMFTVNKVPKWANEFVKKHDRVCYISTGSFITEDGFQIGLERSHVKFVEYIEYKKFIRKDV